MGRNTSLIAVLLLAGCASPADEFMLGDVRGPEACNGIDDDGNGVVDEWVGTWTIDLVWPTGLWAGHPPQASWVPVQVPGVAERLSVQTSAHASTITEHRVFDEDGGVFEVVEQRGDDGSLVSYSESLDGVEVYVATFSEGATEPTDLDQLLSGWRLELDEQGRLLREIGLKGTTSWTRTEYAWHDEEDGGFARVTSRPAPESEPLERHMAYDAEGRILWVADVLETGDIDEQRTVYRYEDGHLVEVSSVDMETGEETVQHAYAWTFSDDGLLEHVQQTIPRGEETLRIDDVYSWDADGRLVQVTHETSDAPDSVGMTVTYNPFGGIETVESVGVMRYGDAEEEADPLASLTTFGWDDDEGALRGSSESIEGILVVPDYVDTFVCR